jgi:hypothetical protein
MPLLVTMLVYSGVTDPQWVISGDNERELRRLTDAAALARPAHDGVLGYRGFNVVDTMVVGPDPQLLFQVQSAGATISSASIVGSPDIEDFLLWTGQTNSISDELTMHVRAALQAPIAPAVAAPAVACPPCNAPDAPRYNPALWNNPPVQGSNNCYNYANNQATNTFAQPGCATGDPYTSPSCDGVIPAARSDGLVPCPNFAAPLVADRGWYVALVIWPGQDYHWYRQDNTGCWSHKPGKTAAANTDNSGHLITDPRTCDRGPYTVFCTFMVTKRTVHIR